MNAEGDRLIKLPEVLRLTGLSRSTLYRKLKAKVTSLKSCPAGQAGGGLAGIRGDRLDKWPPPGLGVVVASDGREHEYLATDSTSTGSGYGAVIVIGVFSSSRVRGIPDGKLRSLATK